MKKQKTLPFTWAMQQVPDGLTTTDKLVLAVLTSFANKDGTHVYPSRQTLANYTGLSPRTITRSIKNLLDGGWIRKGDQEFSKRYRADRRPFVYEIVLTRKPGEVTEMQVDEHGVDITDDETPEVERGDVSDQSIPEIRGTSDDETSERVDTSDSNGWTQVSTNHSYNHSPSTNVDGGAGVLLGAGNPQPHHGENESPSVTNEEGVAHRPTLVGTNYPTDNPPSQSRVWMPTEAAMKTARNSVTVLSINIHLTRYRVRKAEQGKAPNSAEWLRWLLEDEQKAVQAERTKALAEGRSKRKWFGVAGDE